LKSEDLLKFASLSIGNFRAERDSTGDVFAGAGVFL
jgi:hypothetical protein